MYNLGMFGKKNFCSAVNYDVIGIHTTGSSRNCGRTVFKIVSPIANFETINGVSLVARLLQ